MTNQLDTHDMRFGSTNAPTPHEESFMENSWPAWPIFDETERRQLLEVLDSGKWWFGEKVKRFELEFAAFQGAPYAVSCTNGTAAIEMALRGLGVLPGDEVIVPPYSFIATASAVVTVGAVPVFADIDPDTLCVDPVAVQARITSRTKAIVPVHVAGCMADMDALNRIARQHKLWVLEDAAHAWGSQRDNRGAGAWGNCGTFSFQMSKNLTAGEGGVMVTNDAELADLCRSYSHCGRRKDSAWYDHDYLGSNLRMTEFQAAILVAQLGRARNQMRVREISAGILTEALHRVPGIKVMGVNAGHTRRSYHMYVFRVDEALLGISRDELIAALNAKGIPASKGWYRPLYANGVFQNANGAEPHGIKGALAGRGLDYRAVHCPVCEQVCRDAVWIPQQVLLGERDQIARLAAILLGVIESAQKL
jgi:dTDP-4-amino-4,6-dideoxygalactose transaminase